MDLTSFTDHLTQTSKSPCESEEIRMSEQAIRVLCVDDNPLVADGVRIRLQLECDGVGSPFEWAGHLQNADELVETVKRTTPDVVLLDIDMPGKDAMAALAELAEAAPHVRTIILSGYSREDYLDRAVEAGAWGYISKNDAPDQIVEAVRRVMQGQFAFGRSLLHAASK
jgi:two-component system, NarL family, response regulator DesR